MLKLQDFAKECGVTDRQIQRLLKKYDQEVSGHYERRGANGTWLDQECQKILRSKMKVKELVLADQELQNRIQELEERLERKDVIIERLQQRESEKDIRIEQLKQEKLLIEEKNQERIDAAVRSAEDNLKIELEQQHREKVKGLQEHYNQEIKELQEQLSSERNKKWYQKLLGR